MSFEVQLGQLRDDATTFEAGGDSLEAMATTVSSWGTGIPDWGILSDGQAPFEALVSRITDYCSQGKTEMHAVGENLRAVADVYEAEEAAGVHAASGLY